ncbi:TetR/AcrR family transcriptional regulator [Kitasatospora sp. CM 4170]|uniref:TetR/AcrR family transcriptional regulator n=1 Tax=Kitasatospora aburaviensis TaxID=67265 RepID=A0ABW1FCH8_9ACTN|nr:TetR/AcrR family transcriptional regulator [Kitasatospora sp. CM 4170]WNM48015.1 TetR/AcrR family transcriptional regulator [Kitasatospora sp. CM 4170]
MTPARGDHAARRLEVSEAVWRVLSSRGFGGLTLRAVAAEMGASTGLLTHYFPNKRALVAYALDELDRRSLDRPRRNAPVDGTPLPPAGLPRLRAALLDILPLDEAAEAGNRIWVGSWDASLADPDLAAAHAVRYARAREMLAEHVEAAQRLGELPDRLAPAELAAGAQAFVLGLVVQALLAPSAYPPERQTDLLDAYLAGLAATPADRGTS